MSLLNIGGLGNITSALIGGTSCIPDPVSYTHLTLPTT